MIKAICPKCGCEHCEIETYDYHFDTDEASQWWGYVCSNCDKHFVLVYWYKLIDTTIEEVS